MHSIFKENDTLQKIKILYYIFNNNIIVIKITGNIYLAL